MKSPQTQNPKQKKEWIIEILRRFSIDNLVD